MKDSSLKLETACESQYDKPFRKKPQFAKKDFGTAALASIKPTPYAIEDEEGEIMRGKF